MASNLDRYEEDFKRLKDLGFQLELRMQFDLYPEKMREQIKKQVKDKNDVDKFIKIYRLFIKIIKDGILSRSP